MEFKNIKFSRFTLSWIIYYLSFADLIQYSKLGVSGHLSRPLTSSGISNRPLILYSYFEAKGARTNLEFFIRHGLHAQADFVFILNGENDAEKIIPTEPNIRYVKRENKCYDLGSYAEILQKDGLYKKYKEFILMNASLRGPFVPYWADGCRSDMYLSKVTDEVKVIYELFTLRRKILT